MLLNIYVWDSSTRNLISRINIMPDKWVHLTISLLMALVVMAASAGLAWAQDEKGSFVFCYQGEIEDHRLVVVDKQMQRTLVFMYVGDLVLVDEYPCGTGERQGDKTTVGDEKTPEGVYFITHRYLDSKVTIFGDRGLAPRLPQRHRPSGRPQGRRHLYPRHQQKAQTTLQQWLRNPCQRRFEPHRSRLLETNPPLCSFLTVSSFPCQGTGDCLPTFTGTALQQYGRGR